MSEDLEKKKAQQDTEEAEVKIVPEGTFGGSVEKAELIKEGKVVPGNTGDQGGGQN